MYTSESYNIMPYNSRADTCQLMAEQYDTKSNVNMVGFNPSLKHPACLATLMSCDTTKQSLLGWLYIYIYIFPQLVSLSNVFHIVGHNALPFHSQSSLPSSHHCGSFPRHNFLYLEGTSGGVTVSKLD